MATTYKCGTTEIPLTFLEKVTHVKEVHDYQGDWVICTLTLSAPKEDAVTLVIKKKRYQKSNTLFHVLCCLKQKLPQYYATELIHKNLPPLYYIALTALTAERG